MENGHGLDLLLRAKAEIDTRNEMIRKILSNDKKSNLSKKADFKERDKGILLLLKKKNKKKGIIAGESVLKIWRNFSYFLAP